MKPIVRKLLINLIIIIVVLVGIDKWLASEADKEVLNDDASAKQVENQLEGMSVHFIDVGQADSAYIEFDDYNVLIDAGDWSGDEVVPYLKEQEVESLDLVIGSHEHADHIGQMDKVLEEFEVKEVWMPGNEHATKTYYRVLDAIMNSEANYEEPRAGEIYEMGDVVLEVLNPYELTGDYNNDSIVLKVTYDDVSFLFTGDAEIQAEKEMINEWNEKLSSTVLKAGHHGSETSSTKKFLELVDPSVTVLSYGIGNDYKHPHSVVLDRLEQVNTDVYSTASHGNIIITTDGKNIHVETERERKVIPGD